jgi:hypothetical protein
MTTSVFMLAMVGLTSIGSYLVGVKWLGFPGRALRPAVDKMLECIGATLVFAALNVVLAAAIILVLRSITGTFVSIYVINDVTWLGLSLLQGLTFSWWRALAGSRERGKDR